jgi:hypothetical protein
MMWDRDMSGSMPWTIPVIDPDMPWAHATPIITIGTNGKSQKSHELPHCQYRVRLNFLLLACWWVCHDSGTECLFCLPRLLEHLLLVQNDPGASRNKP